ncbi:Hypothetical_protein [Hexamita inflata]|uniref:Hypothetical_protein n=1 Tax=Hexamita inflata TaxID=28002 RepID=A0AA86R5X1_9EUKA|nr:Hypothetical protein HINF_LOCUS55421 [Hexamita inflata]
MSQCNNIETRPGLARTYNIFHTSFLHILLTRVKPHWSTRLSNDGVDISRCGEQDQVTLSELSNFLQVLKIRRQSIETFVDPSTDNELSTLPTNSLESLDLLYLVCSQCRVKYSRDVVIKQGYIFSK